MESPSKPLRGIRVLELARTLAGPWMGQLLADMGADVVKIERSEVGDETRVWGPPFVQSDGGESIFSAYFQACNRGKRSVEADFSNPDDRALVRRLIANADIVVENFRVGTLARYQLDAKSMMRDNPRLVWCSISGFGQTGPYAQRAAYDFVIQAMSGLMALNGTEEAGPRSIPLPVSDLFTGLYGAIAVLAALNRRHETGLGTVVDLSLLDTQVSAMSQDIIGHLLGRHQTAARRESDLVPKVLLQTADAQIALVIASDLQFARLIEAMGCSALADDERFKTNELRLAHLADLLEELTAIFRNCASNEVITRLADFGVPVGRVNSLSELTSDPHIAQRELITEAPPLKGCKNVPPSVRMPALFNGQAALPETPAPRLGEHTNEVRSDPRWGA
ncbi:CaiB/BaiF CoA transferase family protein [Paraburkholderia aspalathi]|uniref:CaiB/BaiF CoA transferase family protein n=1 Tax=Paraburkholderia aspalathi TaxID=1324617 RepID=UPI001B2444F7|nr:CaiB/BaiF CoA-transferase family protein [Paraburkholderia aspalathi]CAE6737878.1 Acetyl-CoA:oxalate CoA-transferase [Paraburkholderia aspalathi]